MGRSLNVATKSEKISLTADLEPPSIPFPFSKVSSTYLYLRNEDTDAITNVNE